MNQNHPTNQGDQPLGTFLASLPPRLQRSASKIWELKHLLPYWAMHNNASRQAKHQDRWQTAIHDVTFNGTVAESKTGGGLSDTEGGDMGEHGLDMSDKTTNVYHTQKGSTLLGDVAKVGAGMAMGGVLGAATTAGGILLSNMNNKPVVEQQPPAQSVNVQDGRMAIEFIGGEPFDPLKQD